MTNFLNLPAQVFLPLPQFSFLLLAPATFPLPQNKKLLPISVTTTIAAPNSTTSTVAITTITQLLLHFRLSKLLLLAGISCPSQKVLLLPPHRLPIANTAVAPVAITVT